MSLLAKEDILAVSDLKTQDVEVPEWGGTVRVRMMSGTDRDAFESSMVTIDAEGKRKPDLKDMKAKLVALTLVDEAGNLMFGAAEVGHLAAKSAAALERVFTVAARLNGIGAAAEDEAVKNSEAALSGSSTSDSPSL